MLETTKANAIINKAFERLSVPQDVSAKLADHITAAFLSAELVGIFQGAGDGVDLDKIMEAVTGIPKALTALAGHFEVIHKAMIGAAAKPGAHGRAEGLSSIQKAMLGIIASSVLSNIRGAPDADSASVADSMPEYHALGWSNAWLSEFDLAASRANDVAQAYSRQELRTVKSHTPRDDRLISELGKIYFWATGNWPIAYRSSNVDPSHRAPFCQFVADLWPILEDGSPAPKDNKIKAALQRLPPSLGE